MIRYREEPVRPFRKKRKQVIIEYAVRKGYGFRHRLERHIVNHRGDIDRPRKEQREILGPGKKHVKIVAADLFFKGRALEPEPPPVTEQSRYLADLKALI